jgi:1-deoxy-D-xylulose-5-phosphate synthase
MKLLETIHSPADLKRLGVEQLPALAEEIRRAICEQVSVSGGHLAPNLGVVELTIALHYVFDFAHDRLLFDVGHQCYPHKLLTGRLGLLGGLRTSAGISGFPEPNESPYDLFRVGHAGTAISTAVGMARGDALRGESFDRQSNATGRRVVSLIGDASIVNGVAMEGLNNAGTLGRQFLVVLNDNGMSIAKPQGAVARHFDRLRLSHVYTGMKKQAKQVLERIPGGSLIEEAYHRAGDATKVWINEGSWFEHFGLMTVGPVDGHDLPTLIEVLSEARDFDRPMLLHVKTIKGKGYGFAEGDATCFHSPAPFHINDDGVAIPSGGRSFTAAFADAMLDLLERDETIVAATAAMPDGTGLHTAIERFPERVWDTGICESHALDMLAGLAKTGFKPFFAVYSTFLQRAFDQAFQEVALQGLPVRLCLDRAGLVGGDGAVHHGFCDVALLRTLPDAAIVAAIDEPSLRSAMTFMQGYEEGLSAVRYPRDTVSERFAALGQCPAFELGRARHLAGPSADEAPDAAALVFGALAAQTAEAIGSIGASARVALYDARFAKPIDEQLIRTLLESRVPIITIEDHGITGGFGAAVLEAAQAMGLDTSGVTRLAIPDQWIMQDSRKDQLAQAGLDPGSIARAIRGAMSGGSGVLTEAKPIKPSVEFPVVAKGSLSRDQA